MIGAQGQDSVVPGAQGQIGAQGIIGTSIQGTSGATIQGAQGIIGTFIQGSSGAQGIIGTFIQGSSGATIQGAAGTTIQGTAGAQGTVGASIQGTSGATIQGSTGTSIQGAAGAQGIIGPVAGSANQVVYKDGSNNPAGSANLVFNGTTLTSSGIVVGNDTVNTNQTKIQIASTAASQKLGFSGGANNITEENLYVWNFTAGASAGISFQSNGTLTAVVKSFVIDHPTEPGMQLQYGVLEGPEHSVYVRGKLKNLKQIDLPLYWHALVHEESVTVNLTSIGKKQDLWVEQITPDYIIIGSDSDEVEYFYTVFAERKDIDKLVTEFKTI
jgi:hypothetical protein